MLEVVKTDDGDIIAVCEILRLNSDGVFDVNGTVAAIMEIEVSRKYRGTEIVRRMLSDMRKKYDGVDRVVFCRAKKYPGRNRAVMLRR